MITNINLKNFKCFEDFSIELSNLNIFSGINSVGKSTVIQSLLLLRQSFESNCLKKGLQLNGEYVNIGNGVDLLNYFSDDDVISINIKSDIQENRLNYIYQPDIDFLHMDTKSDIKNLKKHNLFGNGFTYISASRMGPQRFYTGATFEVTENNHIGSKGELFATYIAIMKDEKIENTKVLHESEPRPSLINQVNAWLSEISPSIELIPDINKETGVVSLRYGFTGTSYKNTSSPINVGYGLSYVAPVVLSLLRAKVGDLIILENPEAHLHPKGQRRMGELLALAAAGGIQLIVETHSDHILNGIRLSVKKQIINKENVKLNFFSKKKQMDSKKREKIVYSKLSPLILDNGQLSDWPDGFFDEWEKALMELV